MNIEKLLDGRYYISRDEYACRHCGVVPEPESEVLQEAIIELFTIFKKIREAFNTPLYITSGYRCPQHTLWLVLEQEKSHFHSPHMFGIALDFLLPEGMRQHEAREAIRLTSPDIRLGWKRYKGFVHIDTAYVIREAKPDEFWAMKAPWVLQYWHRGAEW